MSSVNRRQMLAAMAGAGAVASAQNGKRRNVVFILSDDHRYDALGFLKAQPWLETPQLDR
jgi:N-acetylglucosamine-6-sulfatase